MIKIRALLCSAAIIGLSFCLVEHAHATKTVTSPYVEKGEKEIESKTTYDLDDDDAVDGTWEQAFEFGYGITDRWASSIGIEFEHEGETGADTETKKIEWENKFQLTEQGEYWLDLGLKTELAYNTSGGADEAEFSALLAKDTGEFSHIANIYAETDFGEGSEDEIEPGIKWQTLYRASPEFKPGFEAYSNFGPVDEGTNFDEQEHQFGPVINGEVLGVGYDVGYLFGLSDASPDGQFKLNLEYEWQ